MTLDVPLADVQAASSLIRSGGLVAFPTETVYGLGADAFRPEAVARIFETKGRPRFDPLIVHLSDGGEVDRAAAAFPPEARLLAERFWPGPLTLVLPRRSEVPDLVTAGLPTVGLRVPNHPVALAFLRACATPVAAPSANRFGGVSPTTADHVRASLGDAVDFVLDGGPCRVGLESTIVGFPGGRPTVLRLGGTPVETLEEVLGRPLPLALDAPFPGAPGQLPRHYAPLTPLRLFDPTSGGEPPPGARVGLLCLADPPKGFCFAAVEELSPRRDLQEAAARLFSALRRLDAAGLDLILAVPFPEEGLGRAINDRLRRASQRSSF